MLVLSRKLGESVAVIDEHGKVIAVVTVTDTRSDRVKLGFSAPELKTKFLRHELAGPDLSDNISNAISNTN